MLCAILAVCTCICDLSIHKSVWSPADPAIPCLSVDVIILFVHMSITYCLFTAFGQLSAIWHNAYGMFLCIAHLDFIMFVSVSPLLLLLELPCTLSSESVS